MGNVLLQLFDITKQFNMFLQPQLLLIQKTKITVEGVARKLNPDINFWEVSKPEIETWLGPSSRKQLNSKKINFFSD